MLNEANLKFCITDNGFSVRKDLGEADNSVKECATTLNATPFYVSRSSVSYMCSVRRVQDLINLSKESLTTLHLGYHFIGYEQITDLSNLLAKLPAHFNSLILRLRFDDGECGKFPDPSLFRKLISSIPPQIKVVSITDPMSLKDVQDIIEAMPNTVDKLVILNYNEYSILDGLKQFFRREKPGLELNIVKTLNKGEIIRLRDLGAMSSDYGAYVSRFFSSALKKTGLNSMFSSRSDSEYSSDCDSESRSDSGSESEPYGGIQLSCAVS